MHHLCFKCTSISICREIARFIDSFVDNNPKDVDVLHNSLIIQCGIILDKRIVIFQNRCFFKGNDNWEINGPQICNGGLKREFLEYFYK